VSRQKRELCPEQNDSQWLFCGKPAQLVACTDDL
jgi:hypothetical protein